MGDRTAYLSSVVKDDLTNKVRFGQSPILHKRTSHGKTWEYPKHRGLQCKDPEVTAWLTVTSRTPREVDVQQR